MQLLCDLLFKGDAMLREPLVAAQNKPFKRRVGLDPEREFFSARELAECRGLTELLVSYDQARRIDPQANPSPDQRRALDLSDAANRLAALASGEPMAIIPAGAGRAFGKVGLARPEPGAERVREALQAFGKAYLAGEPPETAARLVREAVDAAGTMDASASKAVRLEVFYVRHDPWRKTQYLYGLAILAFAFSRLLWPRALIVVAILATVLGAGEHLLGVGLRVAILQRAPVSNTFESLLWMGLVGIAVAAVARLLSRRSYYLFAGVCAALASVLFAGLVPLTDRTNALPAVLRSNYWLIVHVLTIVASYGVLAVAAVLGHVYLVREVLAARRLGPEGAGPSHPLVAQTYRCIQIGLLLLTAGTILGGVWAADSWGRFWGWDPKETWALISIVVYFAVLHARHVRWLRDFGLAASSILGFVVIVWTFYGVNYVMASGLHSYGFGSGGEVWVGLWAAAELALVVVSRLRLAKLRRASVRDELAHDEDPVRLRSAGAAG